MTSSEAGQWGSHRQTRSLLDGVIGRWQLDPSATTVELHTAAMWGLVKVRGTFKATEGDGTVTRNGTVTGRLVIDANSINTNNKRRDVHLRSGGIFGVDRNPTITYVATSMSEMGDGLFNVSGALIMKGRSQSTDLVVKASEAASGQLILTAEVEIDRSDWGVVSTRMGVGFVNRVVVDREVHPVMACRPW